MIQLKLKLYYSIDITKKINANKYFILWQPEEAKYNTKVDIDHILNKHTSLVILLCKDDLKLIMGLTTILLTTVRDCYKNTLINI